MSLSLKILDLVVFASLQTGKVIYDFIVCVIHTVYKNYLIFINLIES